MALPCHKKHMVAFSMYETFWLGKMEMGESSSSPPNYTLRRSLWPFCRHHLIRSSFHVAHDLPEPLLRVPPTCGVPKSWIPEDGIVGDRLSDKSRHGRNRGSLLKQVLNQCEL